MSALGKFYVYRDEDGHAVAVAKRIKGPHGGVMGIDFCKMGVPYGSTTREDINNRAEFIASALNTFLNTSAALAAKDAEIARLEDELYDAQHGPWPEWAEKILKAVRSYSGYDGYDDASDGIDLVGEVEEALSELYSEAERLRAKLKEVTDAKV